MSTSGAHEPDSLELRIEQISKDLASLQQKWNLEQEGTKAKVKSWGAYVAFAVGALTLFQLGTGL